MKLTRPAAAASIGLSALFLVVYSTCNYVTSLRSNVPSLYFPWERHIPFVPGLIIPYMSIDLFFVVAPLLIPSPRELRTFSLRVVAAIVIAGVCFLMIPLKFAFVRPDVDGALGLIFNNFRSLDLPYNEFPSLHITLWCLLLDVYFRHTKGLFRILLVFWFALIAASTVLTYQHHLPDILGGLALATVCFYLFRENITQPEGWTPNRRIAVCYFIGTIILIAGGFALPPLSYVLLWPALSTLLLSAAYLFVGPAVYRKAHGQIPISARILLCPAILGQYVSLLYYSRQCRPFDRLTPQLVIGRRLSSSVPSLSPPITAVIDLTAEFTERRPFRELPYLSLPTLDLTAPTPNQITQAIDFIQQHSITGTVYLHCKIGYSRTAVIAGAYLLSTGSAASLDEALATLRRVRPQMVIRHEAMRALEQFARLMAQGPLTPPAPSPAPATV